DCCNSVKNLPDDLRPTESLEHGFGTANIYRTVKKNFGTTAIESTEDTYTTSIVVPIIDEKKRLHPPKKH
ncbi:ATP-binding protein, partial [Eubacterium sp. MSJ-13]|uniref:GHKL domain-containing protein n=1 Tax=Eubacterium sp. MSJ-13 TaxID=2841513 RepID=UPI001C0FEC1A